MPPELLADVAVRASIAGADPIFTYRIPPRLHALVRVGQLVWAPLRRQRVQGIVLDLYASAGAEEMPPLLRPDPGAPLAADAPQIRDIVDLADQEVALTTAQIRLARWLGAYYRAPLYEMLALMLPPGVSQDAEPTWAASPAGLAAELGTLPEGERAVLYFLRQHGPRSERDLRRALRGSDAELREIYAALHGRGLLVRGVAFSRARARPRIERLARLRVAPDELDASIAALAGAPRQQQVLTFLARRAADHDPAADAEAAPAGGALATGDQYAAELDAPAAPIALGELYAATGVTLPVVRALEQKGLLELVSREVRRDPLAGDAVPPDVPPPLTSAQERAWRPISEALDRQGAARPDEPRAAAPAAPLAQRAFLLHGVTGSGKTELYLRAIARVLRRGQQALVLVPEIALTAQLVRRFAARFPGRLAVLHSGLSLGERYDEWRRLRSGEAQLAIGSRSAAFAPLPHLALIIVDEEHEASFKSDGSPRYHARDVALRLADLTGSVAVLGSATPSVESYAAAQEGRLTLIALAERVGMGRDANGLPRSRALPLPPVRIVDMRHELQDGNRSIFSRPLQQALRHALGRGEQAILFLNRRGAAAFVMCRDCGHVVACPNCSTPLTLHYEDDPALSDASRQPEGHELVCHGCNHRELVPPHCPNCWSRRIKSFGVGTQRVVDEVARLFPQARTLRWDRDTVSGKGAHGRMLDLFLQHRADVLVGTQMIAKGLDLPLVSVVGVVAADTGLHLPDFRAGERTFQLLTQVAGRAGRRVADSQVVIQTYSADHYALLAAQEHDYHAFYRQEIAFRRQAGYPPFSRLVRFVYSSGSDARSKRAAEALAQEVAALAQTVGLADWGIIGPAPAFFHRQRNRYRWHLLLRAADPTALLDALPQPHGWVVDVDPVHVL